MTCIRLTLSLLGFVLFSASAALALPPEVVQRAEKATAVVQDGRPVNGRQLGSAFCVAKSGVFVTSARVVVADGMTVQLVFSAGRPNQRTVEAKVVRRDMEQDIAILQAASTTEPFESLELSDQKVYETMDVAVFAYPFRNGFNQNGGDVPPITVKLGHVTSLPEKNGRVDRIVIDSSFAMGTQGGPVVDTDGRVVGMLDAEVFSGREERAVPAEGIRQMLLSPQIGLQTSVLSYEKRHERQELVLNVKALTDPAPAYEAELAITEGDRPPRTIRAKVIDGVATFAFVPVTSDSSGTLPITARFKKGTVNGVVENTSFQIGEQSLKLDGIRRLRHDDGASDWQATLTSGEKVTGKLTGLDSLSVDLGATSTKLDVRQATCLTIESPRSPVRWIGYSLTVKADGQVVGREAGTIDLAGAPAEARGGNSLSTAGPKIDISNGNILPEGQVTHTVLLGGMGGSPIELRTPEPRNVIGFAYKMSVWANRPIVESFEPVYERPAIPRADLVLAKEGYVVGGILVDSDLYTHAVRVIFVRMENGRPNAEDNYLSDWIGQPVSHQLPKQLAGHGERVIGVCGRKGLNMDAIGLVIIP